MVRKGVAIHLSVVKSKTVKMRLGANRLSFANGCRSVSLPELLLSPIDGERSISLGLVKKSLLVSFTSNCNIWQVCPMDIIGSNRAIGMNSWRKSRKSISYSFNLYVDSQWPPFFFSFYFFTNSFENHYDKKKIACVDWYKLCNDLLIYMEVVLMECSFFVLQNCRKYKGLETWNI